MLPHIFKRALATQASALPSPVVHLPLTHWPVASTSTSTPASDLFVTLPSHIFSSPPRPDILHQCVVAHLSNLRQGTSATKNRAQVRGSTRKIMRQKGTGKARVGDIKSPIRRGGGHAFAKRQRDWTIGLNRKVWELGVRTALSERWRRGELTIIPESPVLPAVSTRSLVESIRDQPSSSTWHDSLFLLSNISDSFSLSARNLPKVDVRHVLDLDVYSILQGKRVIMDMPAVQMLEQWLGKRTQEDMDEFEDQVFAGAELAVAGEQEGADGPGPRDGGVKKEDVVIEQEEAPIAEKRTDEDPLKQQEKEGADKGDAIREHMDNLAQQQKDDVVSEDGPSIKQL